MKEDDISCDSAARQMIHMKCQGFFSLKKYNVLFALNMCISKCRLLKVTHHALATNKHRALDNMNLICMNRRILKMNKFNAF